MAVPKIKENYKYTYADYLTWNDNKRWEIIQGVPYCMSPAPSRQHQVLLKNLLLIIGNYLEDKSCEVYPAPFDVSLPGYNEKTDEEITTVVQPDIVVVCDESKLNDRGCMGTPDLVIEILSPYTSARDLKDKFFLYEKHGVKEYWVVDPSNKIVTLFKLAEDSKYAKPVFYSTEDKIETNILDGLTVDLKRVFK